MQCITQKLKKICRKESVLFAQKNLSQCGIGRISLLALKNAIFSGKIKLRETVRMLQIRENVGSVKLFLSLKKTITFIAPMNVLGAKQTGDMQRSRDMPHGYQHFSIKIDCWHFNATKFVKRAVQKAPCLFITGTVLVKQTRRIMLSIISEFFAESITSNYIRSITASSTANSLCSGKSLRLWAFSQ